VRNYLSHRGRRGAVLLAAVLVTVAAIPLGAPAGDDPSPFGGEPLTGKVEADFRPPGMTEPAKEEDFWFSESTIGDKGIEFNIDTTVNWGGMVAVAAKSSLSRPARYPYPWQELPLVTIAAAERGQITFYGESTPGKTNYELYKSWEQGAYRGLPEISPADTNGKWWNARGGSFFGGLHTAIVAASFQISEDGEVNGTILLPKRREKTPQGVTPAKSTLVCQQLKMTGRLEGRSPIRFNAEGLRGTLNFVGRGYALDGEIESKKIDYLLCPQYEKAWRDRVEQFGKPPEPKARIDEFGLKRYE
jgi:hypothetical protein